MQLSYASLRRVAAVLLSVVVLSWTGVSAASADDNLPTLPRCYEAETFTPPPAPDPDVEVCYPF